MIGMTSSIIGMIVPWYIVFMDVNILRFCWDEMSRSAFICEAMVSVSCTRE